MNKIYYDLHIHSCLSPCGDMEMTPYNIVAMSALKGLDVIAITDHNSCKNCEAALNAAKDFPIKVICGMELCTSEEVHLVCLFKDLENALRFDAYVDSKLPNIQNHPDVFGRQVIMDEKENEIGEVSKLLINASTISVSDVPTMIKEYNGICFPAHIDKPSYSILSNLGFVPPECHFEFYELFDIKNKNNICDNNPILNSMIDLKNSDAHYLEDISEQENFLLDKKLLDFFNISIL